MTFYLYFIDISCRFQSKNPAKNARQNNVILLTENRQTPRKCWLYQPCSFRGTRRSPLAPLLPSS